MWNDKNDKFWIDQTDGTFNERICGWVEALDAVMKVDGMQTANSMDVITDFANHQWFSSRLIIYQKDDFVRHWFIMEQSTSNFQNIVNVSRKLIFAIADEKEDVVPEWKIKDLIDELIDHVEICEEVLKQRPNTLEVVLNCTTECDGCRDNPHDNTDEENCTCCHCTEYYMSFE